ncbi:MAG: response regulator transcription factor [Candidatus Omnitrophica bacterium]|nr:response regulator transcription factor [Candidatus Omnitrophota bacterium]
MIKKKILIIEDEPDAAALLKLHLEKYNYEVLLAGDGKEGYRLARTRAPDLILLDLMIPEMDGFWVCSMVKSDKKFAGIAIIALTARSAPDDMKTAKECGANDYVVKPFEFSELLVKIRGLIGES